MDYLGSQGWPGIPNHNHHSDFDKVLELHESEASPAETRITSRRLEHKTLLRITFNTFYQLFLRLLLGPYIRTFFEVSFFLELS